jgi:ABC-type oligopeptide transport system substrate-binding subunit/DNA-binding SARP family transcriptional activator
MSALQIHLLGPLEIRSGDQLLSKPATAKSQSLLAYLALHRHTIQYREQLASLFWDNWPANKARRSLSTALWRIRRCLPDEDVILGESDTVQFDPTADLWLDVEEFLSHIEKGDGASLQSAVALYRGNFLDGFYDDWIINERYRLENLFCEALSHLMTLQMAKGSYHEAIATSLRLLEFDPLREKAYRLSMRAYCHLGRRNKALAQYHRCRDMVEEELSAEPMPETTELYQSILSGGLKLDENAILFPVQELETPAHVPAGRSPLDALVLSRLVGRDQELSFLQDHWQEAKAGRGGLVLVSGEAGVGKTRLVDEFASRLRRQGHRVLWGRCYEFELILPYQPFAEALQAVLPIMTNTELVDLPLWALRAMAGMLPELLEKIPTLPHEISSHLDQEQARLFDAVTRLLVRISSTGAILIVLEDLHWASESTLQLLHYLLRALVEQPVLVLGTLRAEVVRGQHPLLNLQEQLRREQLVESLFLPRLSLECVENIIVEMSGAGEMVLPLARKLYQETEGNPFFLIEIVKSLFDKGEIFMEKGIWMGDFSQISQGSLPLPAAISEAILTRVRTLDENSRDALQLAAILGNEFDFDTLNAAWERGEEPTLKALDDLLRRRLISETTVAAGRDYIFTHHKIREVVYSSIPRLHQQHAHARVGDALEQLYGSQIETPAGELAYHFEQCRDLNEVTNEKAITYLLVAGDHARGLYAFSEAIDYYQRALEILKEGQEYKRTARTLMKLGLTHHLALDFQRARQTYEQSFASWQWAMETSPATLPSAPHALKLVVFEEPYTFNPIVVDDFASASIIKQIFSGLVELTPELDIVPDVARDWHVLDEGRKYIFRLREDVYWSDGLPVTAEDFEYSWKQVLDPVVGSVNAHLLRVVKGAAAFQQGRAGRDEVGIRALDRATLVIELEEPAGYFLQLISRLLPVPKHMVHTLGDAWAEVGDIVTNGPFRVESRKQGESLILARNPDYHGRFRGNVERVELAFGLDPETCLEMYDSNALDVLSLVGYPLLKEQDLARQRCTEEYTLMPTWRIRHIMFDAGQPPFDDSHVRQALALAIDREQLTDVIFKGFHSPATGGLLPPGMPGHSPGIGLPYDPERSRQLLAGAGYPDGHGFPTLDALLLNTFAPLGEYLHAQWQKNLGIEVPWKTVDWEEYIHINTIAGLQANMVIFGIYPAYPDPESLLGIEITQNSTNWRHAGYERLVKQARRLQDQEVRMQLYQQAEHILIAEAAIVPLCYHWYPMLVKPWIEKFTISAVLDWFWKDVIIEPH